MSRSLSRIRCSRFTTGARRVERGYASLSTAASIEPPQTPPLLTLDYSTLNSYNSTYVPTSEQLKTANHYFASNKPAYLFTCHNFRAFPADSTVPEVAFLGRSNVGKSTLLNALFNRSHGTTNLANVSSKPGKTKALNVYGLGQSGGAGGGSTKIIKPGMSQDMLSKRGDERQSRKDEERVENWVGKGGLLVVDAPGYGFASQKEWGTQTMKYLENRSKKQLRRAFILIDTEHGLKQTDKMILSLLRDAGVPHQLLLSKVDKILFPTSKEPSPVQLSNRLVKLRKICNDIRKEIKPKDSSTAAVMGDILCFSSTKCLQGSRMGIDGIRWAILQSCGLA